ncbi:hypothetical protein ACFS5N_12220 [Mucilaginibacter ximonensis]|uniref:Mobilization protein MobC n=1 Tax=Mucilaginibacter ximonensis TaxID=538021 RepID=A0ABW5YEJ3_9SPHI
MGRQNEERLDYKIFTRVGKTKFDEMTSLLNNSNRRTMSALLRDVLEHEKIVINTRDTTLDKAMEELSGIRKELLAIGVNINQVTRRFHQAGTLDEQLALSQNVLKEFSLTSAKIETLFKLIDQLSEKWLPE